MQHSRRRFLVGVAKVLAAAGAVLSGLLSPFGARSGRAQGTWGLRRADTGDLAALRDIFNAQRAAGLFPFTDRIAQWTSDKAAAVLATYTGTFVLTLDDTPVGFVAFVDYTRAGTASSISPEIDPEVKILAVRVDQLTLTQRLAATKRLAVAVSRDLQRQGFGGCEATISAQTGFQDLFTAQMDVKHVDVRNGVPEAKLVRYRIGEIVTALEAEGL